MSSPSCSQERFHKAWLLPLLQRRVSLQPRFVSQVSDPSPVRAEPAGT